jgi:heme exporter protein C
MDAMSTPTPHPLWRWASPRQFLALSGRVLPALWATALATLALGLLLGLVLAPTDRQQGEAYRILYLHVPAAWIAMVSYAAMAFWGLLGLSFNTRLSFVLMRALAPTGALFAALTLITGSLWGRPTWGTWWVWDARLTSMLLLFFLSLGFLALTAAIDDTRRADRAGAVLALVGVLNLPVLYFSVTWWNTLHQGASLQVGRSAIDSRMLVALLVCTAGFWLYAVAAVLSRARLDLRAREAQAARWNLPAAHAARPPMTRLSGVRT